MLRVFQRRPNGRAPDCIFLRLVSSKGSITFALIHQKAELLTRKHTTHSERREGASLEKQERNLELRAGTGQPVCLVLLLKWRLR